MSLEVTPLAADDASGFDGLMAIYTQAIEASERKPREAIAAYLRDPRGRILVAREGPDVRGFATLFYPAGADFWLLEYMAVDARERSRGMGARLFEAACDDARARLGASRCVIEIDQPGAKVSAGNRTDARAAFYARLGSRKVQGLSYILPLDVAGPPPDMQLLVHGIAAPIPKATMRDWLIALYTQVYDRPRDDPRIGRMLAGLPEHIGLE